MITLLSLPAGLPSAAVVDLDAIRDNVAALNEHAGAAGVMAVVKGDGYGHGLVPSARAALAGGATWLGVAQLSEGLELRAAGIEVAMLAWLTVPGDRYAEAVRAGIDLGVSARWALDEVAAAAREVGQTARIQLKLDSGLGRNGVTVHDWTDLVDAALKAQADGAVELVGAFSHYAWADAPQHPTVRAQTQAFADALETAQHRGARFQVRHLANSAATLTNPAVRYDLVRAGISVYGLSPVPELAGPAQFGLRPAMTLLARVANVKRVGPGQGVSYGHAYHTPNETTLALLPVGYADGLPRHAGNTGPVLLAGRRYRLAGRVCMDQVVLDLGEPIDGPPAGPEDVRAGDVAVIFGAGTSGEPTAQDWADAAGTISYEIVTRIGSRVPRLYRGGDGPESWRGSA